MLPGTVAATLVVLAAAVLHAAWNAIAHAVEDQAGILAVIVGTSAVVAALALPFVATPARASWPFLACSAALQVGYLLGLATAYRIGQFSSAYPLARGTAPWLVAIVGTTVAGESLTAVQLAGVLVVSAGLASLVLAGGRPPRTEVPALLAAVGTGAVIAAYTVVDGLGVRRSGSVVGYSAWLFLLHGPVFALLALGRRGRGGVGVVRTYARLGALGAVLSLLAYTLVLWAQTRGTLAAVAALRETSVVFGAVFGAVFLHERLGRARVRAAVAIAVGVVLLTLS